jgi:trans-aconitate methyltransferase
MTERERISLKAQSFFDDLWARGNPRQLETSDFERKKYTALSAILGQSHYKHVSEIGCGTGAFTRLLSGIADEVLALHVSVKAIARARQTQDSLQRVEFRIANIMDCDVKKDDHGI